MIRPWCAVIPSILLGYVVASFGTLLLHLISFLASCRCKHQMYWQETQSMGSHTMREVFTLSLFIYSFTLSCQTVGVTDIEADPTKSVLSGHCQQVSVTSVGNRLFQMPM